MIKENIPKDIRKYKTKFLAGFSMREFGSFVLAAGMAMVLYNIQPEGTKSYNYCLPAIIPLLFGFIQVQEMPLEKYLKSTFISAFVAPKNRTYKIDNMYRQYVNNDPIDAVTAEVIDEKTKKAKKVKPVNPQKIKKKAAKESPEFIAYK